MVAPGDFTAFQKAYCIQSGPVAAQSSCRLPHHTPDLAKRFGALGGAPKRDQHGVRRSGGRAARPFSPGGRRWRLPPAQAKGKRSRPRRLRHAPCNRIWPRLARAGRRRQQSSCIHERPSGACALARASTTRPPRPAATLLSPLPSQPPNSTARCASAQAGRPGGACCASPRHFPRPSAAPFPAPRPCRPASPTPSPSSASGGPRRSTSALWRHCVSMAGSGARLRVRGGSMRAGQVAA